MNIKVSFLRSSLHDNKDLDNQNRIFLDNISSNLGTNLEYSKLEDYDCSLKLIFIESGGSEGLFLNNIDKLKEPYYLLTNGSNNSLAASLEILTYLNLHGKKGEILHGSEEYIARRIKEIASLDKVKNTLKDARLGVIGKPSDWLISSLPNKDKLKEKFGVELIDIKIDELISNFKNIDLSKYHENKELIFDEHELDEAKKMYLAIDKIKEDHNLDALTIRCFDLLTTCKTTSCLAFGLLNSKKVISTCEGDIMALVSMEILSLLLEESVFQANPSRIDLEKREIVFAHCTIPFDMLESYKLDTHFESGIGVAIKGELKEDDVTIFRLSSDLKHYFVVEGHIERNLNEKNLCRTQIQIKCDESIDSLLKSPCGNHHLIVYGHHKKLIEKLMNSYSLEKVNK